MTKKQDWETVLFERRIAARNILERLVEQAERGGAGNIVLSTASAKTLDAWLRSISVTV